MSRFIFFVLAIIIISCDNDNAPECFRAQGKIETRNFEVAFFDRVRFEDDVSLIIKEGVEQSVTITSGKNLFEEIKVTIEGKTLVIQDNNGCNLVREVGITQAIVTTPDLIEIRNGSSRDVRSDGILNFPKLALTSNTTGGIADVKKSGDFYLDLNCSEFVLNANGQSVFYLKGTTEQGRIVFNDENPSFQGAMFEIDHLNIFHRGANKMIVNPRLSIVGELRSTGDVIAVNRPDSISVRELFSGQLIFQ